MRKVKKKKCEVPEKKSISVYPMERNRKFLGGGGGDGGFKTKITFRGREYEYFLELHTVK